MNNPSLTQWFPLLLIFLACNTDGVGEEERLSPPDVSGQEQQLLVFTKTSGFRHKSIEKGVRTLRELGEQNGFGITHSEDAGMFAPERLEQFELVVFLSTTEDVLEPGQEAAFKTYIGSGGNFMGIHAATDTEYQWPWYGKMVGAYFKSHPRLQEARIKVVDRNHPATAHLEEEWLHFDEWYNFKNINPDINVLLELDESSYTGGENGAYHPIAWYQEFESGRAFYTGLGHTEEAYDDPDFRQHLLGGILYCLGN